VSLQQRPHCRSTGSVACLGILRPPNDVYFARQTKSSLNVLVMPQFYLPIYFCSSAGYHVPFIHSPPTRPTLPGGAKKKKAYVKKTGRAGCARQDQDWTDNGELQETTCMVGWTCMRTHPGSDGRRWNRQLGQWWRRQGNTSSYLDRTTAPHARTAKSTWPRTMRF